MTIQDVMHEVMGRLPGPAVCGILEAVREVQAIIAARLLLKRSPLLKKETPAALAFAIDDQSKALPSDYYALDGRPYVAGEKPLSPLAGMSTETLQEAGTPKYYEVIGKTLRIHPKTDTAITITVPYFCRPAVPTLLTATLPFYGEFDEVIVEGCVAVLSHGLSVVAERAFAAVIQTQVDAAIAAKELAAEQATADAINDF